MAPLLPFLVRGRLVVSRPRKFKSNAERQRAYRERKKMEREKSEAGSVRKIAVLTDLTDYKGPDPR